MIAAIQVVRDIVIILGFVIITGVVIMVGREVLRLLRKVEDVRVAAAGAVNGLMNPVRGVRGVLLAFSRRTRLERVRKQ